MMFTKTFGLAAAFASLASAVPTTISRRSGNTTSSGSSGSVDIINNLNTTIYAWSVSETSGPMITLEAGSGSYSESWRVNPDGGGISIKLSTTESQDDVLQFEYTESGDTIYWDLSCINMGTDSAFTKYGFAVVSDDSSCPNATCAAGDTACADAYLVPDDNQATHGCPINTALTLTLGK
ncbi:hypothetical protein ASPZODRAFT_127487 [Penicilliopsis zonata CBS 506.65]|uniref:Extracellular thaumatin domain protein n=1 Tax=Penicilliopsis zonata CBS 506.65 TaxID=1073090 RepID=A0A1L9SW55_9EURO|nr:hypothetical protein ASPZODRAFT_127487 [Penicilliopsis zonata CBS 506.65]OJJ51418.1 hypothetical protein ASPZODRAFT_127487 [Penicilliopsis zonata CBS 506.65]